MSLTRAVPDPKKWVFEIGFVRNNEQQWYQKDVFVPTFDSANGLPGIRRSFQAAVRIVFVRLTRLLMVTDQSLHR